MNITRMNTKNKVDVFALSIYGLVVFPKALGHVDEVVTDLFNRLDKWVTPVPAILAETFRSLNECRRAEIVAIPRQDDVLEEKWMTILQNLQEEDIEWRAPWMLPNEILYRCGDFDWSIPETQGLAQCEFSYKGDGYKKKIQEMTNAWRQTRRMKRLAVGPPKTLEYIEWLGKRDFERRNLELEKKIEQMEEEKMNLKLDIDVQKLETKNLRNGKHKAEEDLNSLKTDYKKLRLLVRTAGLGKTSEQWRQEIQEEKIRATSLSKIEQMKKTVEELEMALQNCEAKIEYLEANEDHQNEQLHYF
ncbi:hypothetical protein Golax_025918 [Gossypium laxum]|uniref:DUF7745 domain-containing protein n=1 Tax=Gossypium laxum TaxID=34288 RepID=A0A7J9B413_9ROSI|nr:hypothetical protein [Gossypium laxum]